LNTSKWKSILGFVALDQYPNLPCPYCHQETLNFDTSSIVSREVSEKYKEIASPHFNSENDKKKERDTEQEELMKKMWGSDSVLGFMGAAILTYHEIVKPSYHYCKFTAFMTCASCNDNIAVTGLSQEHAKRDTDKKQLPSLYKIDHFSIPIPMFKVNHAVPTSIHLELLGAFHYFHIDTNVSASKLRRAIEKYCSELGMKPNSLARQIRELEIKYPMEASFLDTLRLVGNEGTHSDNVNEDDLLLAFDIVEDVLTIFPRIAKRESLKAPQAKLEDKFDKKKARTETKTLENAK
jgi:hypothetical protein